MRQLSIFGTHAAHALSAGEPRVTPVGGSADALQALVADAPKHACLLVGHDKHVCVVLGLSLPAPCKQPVSASKQLEHLRAGLRSLRVRGARAEPNIHASPVLGRSVATRPRSCILGPGRPKSPREGVPLSPPDAARLPVRIVQVHAACMP